MTRAIGIVALLLFASPASAQALLGARASHDDPEGPIVVFGPTELFVSRDAGVSFEAMAAPVASVRDVAIERDGTIVVLGGADVDMGAETQLVRLRTGDRVETVETVGWVHQIATGGGVLVATFPSEGAIGISTHGRGFVLHRPPPAFDPAACRRDPSSSECDGTRVVSTDASLFVDRDGTTHLVDVEVNTCGSSDVFDWARVLVVEPDGTMRSRAIFPAPRASDDEAFPDAIVVPPALAVYPTRWTAGPLGWFYAMQDDGRFATLGSAGPEPLGGPRGPPWPGGREIAVVSNGVRVLTQIGAELIRLDGGRARVVDRAIPEGASLVDVDSRGRALALALGEGRLYRWSRRRGWSTLWQRAR